MNFRKLNIRRSYNSEEDNLLEDFYIPVLNNAVEYKRLAGYFSSTSLAIAAKGIIGLIENGGIMELIVSPKLTMTDIEIIKKYYSNPGEYIGEKIIKDIEEIRDDFIKNHVFALCWMLANEKLSLKFAIPSSLDLGSSEGIFHQKIGVFRDRAGDYLSFSGSINETAGGWLKNIEEFKVFRGWVEAENYFVNIDRERFDFFWDDRGKKTRVYDLPSVVKKELVSMAPDSLNKEDFSVGLFYEKKDKINLYPHQKEAIDAWEKNNHLGLLEMATGTGKTFTALGAVDRIMDSFDNLMIIISCPQNHLVQQWEQEIEKFGFGAYKKIIADSTNQKWKFDFSETLYDLALGNIKTTFVLTSHSTFSKEFFQKKIDKFSSKINFLLIADEVHGMGAEKTRLSLNTNVQLRLGLSATPKRWFDVEGTEIIYSYFGDVVYSFGLEHAIINRFLTPYRYNLKFVNLTDEELKMYIKMTRTIISKKGKKDQEEEDLENILFARANIVKDAENKLGVLEEFLDKIGSNIKQTIIYCSPKQKDKVLKILGRRGIISSKFTMETGIKPEEKYDGLSERSYILRLFGEGEIQVLVAMRCLDEGVDVPQAENAIFLSSSGNPREYIQRIGRVIRKYPGKREANLYDIVVKPNVEKLPSELREYEKKIYDKEKKRCEEIGKHALNWGNIISQIYNY